MGIPSVNLNNINLDSNFDDDDPNTIVPIRLSAWHSKFKKSKALEKHLNEELMLAAWHSRRWYNFYMSEHEKK